MKLTSRLGLQFTNNFIEKFVKFRSRIWIVRDFTEKFVKHTELASSNHRNHPCLIPISFTMGTFISQTD